MPSPSTVALAAAATFLARTIQAAPAPAPATVGSSPSITNASQLSSSMSAFYADASAASAAATVGEAILAAIVPAPGPTSIPQAEAELAQIYSANPRDIFASGANILLAGLAGGDYADIVDAYSVDSNMTNVNLYNPSPPIYPSAGAGDAPYSLSEQQLRQIIYIPPDFTYGKLPPVLFFEGTAAVSGQNFGPNFGKLFKQNKVADPVYVNIPGMNLADIQVAAEYAAYAVGYIAALAGRNVTTLSWSAGSLDGQWALKYWPSTRSKVQDAIRISPDHHGTTEASMLCPGYPTAGCTDAIAQQLYNSTFIRTLRAQGGDSAYVPTTNVYSIFDQIVQPQENPNASGALLDARGVGVTNLELQSVCGSVLPGGAPHNTHEGVLYNALAYACAIDAIQHPGPCNLARINTTFQCAQLAAPGLSLADILATEALTPLAVAANLAYEPKTATEPPIMPYAAKDTPAS